MKGFNTQPPEGGWADTVDIYGHLRSFNTQPPEGGWLAYLQTGRRRRRVSTHSRPKAAGLQKTNQPPKLEFQHTAARRRLGRPKPELSDFRGFNTQPPEGGWEHFRFFFAI